MFVLTGKFGLIVSVYGVYKYLVLTLSVGDKFKKDTPCWLVLKKHLMANNKLGNVELYEDEKFNLMAQLMFIEFIPEMIIKVLLL